MIVSAILSLFSALVTLVIAPLPTSTFGALGGSVPSYITAGSGFLGYLDKYLPISDMVTALGFVLTLWLPAVIIYKTVNWIYRHIPMVGGG